MPRDKVKTNALWALLMDRVCVQVVHNETEFDVDLFEGLSLRTLHAGHVIVLFLNRQDMIFRRCVHFRVLGECSTWSSSF